MTSFADYFARNEGSLTAEQQFLLQKKSVAVFGCGGLGGYVIEELVRIGVGRLHLFDPDSFTASNCNRQLNSLVSTLGHNKAEVAANRCRNIHPFVTVHAYPSDFRTIRAEEPLRVDVMVDCLDDIQARRDLANLCFLRGIPMVHGAVSGWCGQVGVQLPGDNLIDRIYPQGRAVRLRPSVLAVTVAVIASLQATEVVKFLLELPSSLHNNLLYIDLKDSEFLLNTY